MEKQTRAVRIVEAVGTAVSKNGNAPGAQRIEAAMAAAVRQAIADGIPLTDSETIRARMMAARAACRRLAI